MSKLRVNAFSVSADGFGAGPDQGRDHPLGRRGEHLHQWFLPTRTSPKARTCGSAATIRQYLQAGLVDEIHVAVSPILLGQGKPLFEGIDLPALGYRVQEHVCTWWWGGSVDNLHSTRRPSSAEPHGSFGLRTRSLRWPA